MRLASRPISLVILVSACIFLTGGFVRARNDRSADPTAHARGKPTTPLRRAFEAGVDSLVNALQLLDTAVTTRDVSTMRIAFRNARTQYKHQEALLEFYTEYTTASLNDPPLEHDDETPPGPLGEVAAFQRVEQEVFSDSAASDSSRSRLSRDVEAMRDAVRRFRGETMLLDVTESDFLDAARTELARVSTLGIAEFDSDASGDAIVESAAALDGVRAFALVAARSPASRVPALLWSGIDAALVDASRQLRMTPTVADLDRMKFIAGPARAVGQAVARARLAANGHRLPVRAVWRSGAATVFDSGAFDAFAFAPDFAVKESPSELALGERLFNDLRLSGPRTRSCASCHVPTAAFADGLVSQRAIGAEEARIRRNTPTLLNAALQPAFFADERVVTLEDQIGAVLASRSEMASSAELAAQRVNTDVMYRAAFASVLGTRSDATIGPLAVRAVLAAYVRSLVTLNSRFDRAARGDERALTDEERKGFTVFMGKARCGICHFAPLFSGVMPPQFTRSELEIIGAPAAPDTIRARLDPDSGRAAVDHVNEHLFAFKVPSLRNVERTAPYMHNGAFRTLEQVVDFYDRGGGSGVGATVPAQTLSNKPLHLSPEERAELVAFLRSLTDEYHSP